MKTNDKEFQEFMEIEREKLLDYREKLCGGRISKTIFEKGFKRGWESATRFYEDLRKGVEYDRS
jgi:hypothetical protein